MRNGRYDVRQLIIQSIPNLSVSIPNLAPQKVSTIGISTFPPAPRALKTRSASARSVVAIDSEIGPSPYFLSGDASEAMNVTPLDLKLACITRFAVSGVTGGPPASLGISLQRDRPSISPLKTCL